MELLSQCDRYNNKVSTGFLIESSLVKFAQPSGRSVLKTKHFIASTKFQSQVLNQHSNSMSAYEIIQSTCRLIEFQSSLVQLNFKVQNLPVEISMSVNQLNYSSSCFYLLLNYEISRLTSLPFGFRSAEMN